MMNTKLPIYLILILTMTACAKERPTQSNIVGKDRDAHGCIGSAGYAWCAKTAQCERPWELAQQKGFALTENSFAEFCKKSD
jgi:hypothetical protein